MINALVLSEKKPHLDPLGFESEIRRQMGLGTYLLYEKSILGWFEPVL